MQVEQIAGVRGSTQSLFPLRNHHNWGSRLGRRRDKFKGEATTLSQLEERAQRSVTLMERHGAKSEFNFEIAMDLLRQQYNMNFKIVCEKCNGCHLYDEILAPEK